MQNFSSDTIIIDAVFEEKTASQSQCYTKLHKDTKSKGDMYSTEDFTTISDATIEGTASQSQVRTNPQKSKKSRGDMYSSRDVAKILKVDEKTIRKWRDETLFGCPILPEDLIDHNGVRYYFRSRIDELAKVFRKDWRTAWANPNSNSDSAGISSGKNVKKNLPIISKGQKVVATITLSAAINELKSRQIPIAWLIPVKHGFKCIGCGNGSGSDGTGATLSQDGTRLLCGKCGKAFSYIDVAAFHYNLDISNFADTVKKISEIEGISIQFFSKPNADTSISHKEKSVNIELQNLIDTDVSDAHMNLDKLPEKEKRGLNDTTLEFFQIGVVFNWTSPSSRLSNDERKKNYPSPRVIVPHLPNASLPNFQLTYYAGLFLSERERLINISKISAKGLYGGSRTPFGLNTLKNDSTFIFISEGEFDALSIWQATNGQFPCLATGGTADNGTLNALQSFFPLHKPKILFAADNDSAGKKFADDFCNKARSFGFPAFPFFFANLDSPKIDANQILIEYGESKLAEILHQKIESANLELDKIERTQNASLFGVLSADYFSDTFLDYLESRKQFADRLTGFANLDSQMSGFLPGISCSR